MYEAGPDWLRHFLLTGSAAPAGATIHSGAGRILDLRMRPLSLAERGLETPTVSLRGLLSDERPALAGSTAVDLEDYVSEIMRSGFPGIRDLPERARTLQLDSYLANIAAREFVDQGVILRRPETLRSWLAAYAAATSTTAAYSTILDAATAGLSSKPSKDTTITYRDVLTQLWLLDPIPPWLPSDNRLQRLAKAPKHQLADPALAARLLQVDRASLLADEVDGPPVPRTGTLAGALFESLVSLGVLVYAQANDAHVGHLRSRGGEREVDLIVEHDHGVVALEVKLTASVRDDDVAHLRCLRDRIGHRLRDAIVVTTGYEAYRRRDGIGVVPAALLGP